ncbi:hypothetical protein FNJ88_04320 [Chryseobacterium sp. SNU WT5]|uniref:hypothetical protein n=1 Tax=Chryseobacterium sp. SNU WT5 TaxID=2594269 RepID=UPI00118050E6|nr:hypothetical protein [Chryseobacterium sp. SNU WT5]QDP84811.1 hypothetical protein FNJ88_04320 [Chryseobacterium sp. SNU WT5]
MFKHINKKKWLIVVGIILAVLNGLALYIINANIANTLAASEMQDPAVELAAQQNGFLGMIFAAVVITLDIIGVMFLLYLLYKFITKILNKSLPKRP